MSKAQIPHAKSNWLFLAFFAVYTAGAALLLLTGLLAALASFLPALRIALETIGQGDGLLEQIWRATARASVLAEQPWELVIDYALSVLNLAFGIFIVARRPGDWVARLLGLGMVGTAMAYNFQAHGTLTLLRLFNVLHYVYHATSGSTYLHALVLFPNGKLVPRRFLVVVVIIYLLMIEETLLPILKLTYGRALFLPTATIVGAYGSIERFLQLLFSTRGGGIFIAIFDNFFQINDPFNNLEAIIEAETTFFVLLFGLLVPLVGMIAQVYRYRTVSSPQERQQTKMVVWALTISFLTGLSFVLVVAAQAIANRAGLTIEAIDEIERSISWIFPLMVSVIPITVLFAILRYRLFDIDLVINRTLVYGPLTAIMAGVFAALSNILQRLFLALTGTQSDLAVIVSALIVAMAFAPIRGRLQDLVDRRFRQARDPEKDLSQFDQQVQSSIKLSNRDQIVRHLLDTAALAFQVEGGAIYLGREGAAKLFYTYGAWNDSAQISVPIEIDGVQLGTLALGARLNGLEYSAQDRASLLNSAGLVARAISVTLK